MYMNSILWNINKIIFKDFLSYHEQAIKSEKFLILSEKFEIFQNF